MLNLLLLCLTRTSSSVLFPRCLRAVAAPEKALTASRDIVGYALLSLLVPRAVTLILQQKTVRLCTCSMCDSCGITHAFLTCQMSQRCSVPNPASLLPLPDGVVSALQHLTRSAHLDQSTDTPLYNPDMRFCLPWLRVGCSIISDSAILKFWSFPVSLLSTHSRAAVN